MGRHPPFRPIQPRKRLPDVRVAGPPQAKLPSRKQKGGIVNFGLKSGAKFDIDIEGSLGGVGGIRPPIPLEFPQPVKGVIGLGIAFNQSEETLLGRVPWVEGEFDTQRVRTDVMRDFGPRDPQ